MEEISLSELGKIMFDRSADVNCGGSNLDYAAINISVIERILSIAVKLKR